MSDLELIEAFESCRLEPARFRHAEHVRLTWLYLRREPLPRVLERLGSGLRRFAASLGKPGVYHETITWAYALLVHERMQRMPPETDWTEFAQANPDLLSRQPPILSSYYQEETLGSELARRVFVFPDRAAVA